MRVCVCMCVCVEGGGGPAADHILFLFAVCLFRGGATLVPVYGPGVSVREKQQRLLPAA